MSGKKKEFILQKDLEKDERIEPNGSPQPARDYETSPYGDIVAVITPQEQKERWWQKSKSFFVSSP